MTSAQIEQVTGRDDLTYDVTLTDTSTGAAYTAGTVYVALCSSGTFTPLTASTAVQTLTHQGAGRWLGVHDAANIANAISSVTTGSLFDKVLFVVGDSADVLTVCRKVTTIASGSTASWASANLLDKFKMYLGRGNGGVMDADELWTDVRCYTWLADAQESVYADLSPIAPSAFMSLPVRLTTADSGVTYTFPGGAYPFGHTEVYAQESGGRDLFATTYNNWASDFVIEGALIRTPGNRARTYSNGPWARYVGMPSAISATVQPSVQPAQARELILFKALSNAADVSQGAMDNRPWLERYADARKRWVTVWGTQYRNQGTGATGAGGSAWWSGLDAANGTASGALGTITIDGGLA